MEVNILQIQIEKESIEDFYQHMQSFIQTINVMAEQFLDEPTKKEYAKHIQKLKMAMNKVYHPELRKLKEESYTLYKAYLGLRDIDKSMAAKLYTQYLDKRAIAAAYEKKLVTKSE